MPVVGSAFKILHGESFCVYRIALQRHALDAYRDKLLLPEVDTVIGAPGGRLGPAFVQASAAVRGGG